jgi:hypothetical protein
MKKKNEIINKFYCIKYVNKKLKGEWVGDNFMPQAYVGSIYKKHIIKVRENRRGSN